MLHFSFQLICALPLLCFALLLLVIFVLYLFVYLGNSEFEDAPPERQRSAGGLSMHSFRRNEYGSSPPTRGESFLRGIHGKWETRSSGRSDKDSDSQSELDSGFLHLISKNTPVILTKESLIINSPHITTVWTNMGFFPISMTYLWVLKKKFL